MGEERRLRANNEGRPGHLPGAIAPLDVVRSLFFIPWFEEHLSQRISAFYFLGWTLMYEMFFYCVFAVTLTLPRSTQLKAVVLCLAALVAIGLLFDFRNGMSFAYTSPLLLEFIAGCVIGRLYEAKLIPPRSLAATLIFLASAVIVWSAWHTPESLLTRAIIWGLPAALVVAAALSFEPDAQKSPSRAGLLLGDASYSIYLSHIIFFLMFNLVAKRAGIVHGFSEIALFYGTIGTAIALVGGLIVYSTIERPMSQLLAGLSKPKAKMDTPLQRSSSS
ncbi:acyltransferase family protein [Bradyrhizobium sp. SEMIA]|nr:acyltransferase family protein [Bradyrhizobium sp. SEMIA]